MPSRVRSYSKINLGLAIGRPRGDGFHSLLTLYQTLALHDSVTVSARRARTTRILLQSNDSRVPTDGRNTAWKMAERFLAQSSVTAEVQIHIAKHLPIQGGMGAGSANAAAALIALERELGIILPEPERLALAAEVGSDVPLFLVGGAVLGTGRGEVVTALPDLTLGSSGEIPCVVALPGIGVSTPAAFRQWGQQFEQPSEADLQNPARGSTMEELSCAYASVYKHTTGGLGFGASGIFSDPKPAPRESEQQGTPVNQQGLSREQRHLGPEFAKTHAESGIRNDLAENSLLALVRTGMKNDFEQVAFEQHPPLREIKRHLMGSPADRNAAIYAALSGSGSALFGLYRSPADAGAAQQRLQAHNVRAIVTKTIPRSGYWSSMFAE